MHTPRRAELAHALLFGALADGGVRGAVHAAQSGSMTVAVLIAVVPIAFFFVARRARELRGPVTVPAAVEPRW